MNVQGSPPSDPFAFLHFPDRVRPSESSVIPTDAPLSEGRESEVEGPAFPSALVGARLADFSRHLGSAALPALQ